MATETVTVELDQATAALLQAKAAAEGLSLADYLRQFAEDMNGTASPLSASAASGSQVEEAPLARHNENGLVERNAEAAAGSPQPGSLTTLHPNQLWLQTNRDDYRGQWVVLYQGELVAQGTDGVAAVETARSQGIPEPFIAFIPAEDNPFAGF